MSEQVKAIVIAGFGTNCEREVAHACSLAGASVDIVHISSLLAGRVILSDYHFLNFAGGFLDGDDLGSAKAGTNRLLHATVAGGREPLVVQLRAFIDAGKLVMGVCNGFQLLVKLGLLPALSGYFEQTCTLTFNQQGRFEDRWSRLTVDSDSPCVFTRGMESLYLPVRHGEGRFVVQTEELSRQLDDLHLCALKYADEDYRPTMAYPDNPNGSQGAVAGICDLSGRLFGLMPHPEAYLHRTHHPRWTREILPEEGDGLQLYRNAVNFISQDIL